MADQDLRIKVSAETGAAQDALGKLADEMGGLARASDKAGTEQQKLARQTAETAQKVEAARQAVERAKRAQHGSGARRWAAYLRATPPATQGGRQTRLIALAMRAGDFGVAEPAARPGLLAWAATCTPPLDPEEVKDALRRAYLARRSPIGTELAAPTVVVDL